MTDKNKTDSILQYSSPVYSSLLQPDLLFGIGPEAIILIVIVSIILASLFSIWMLSLSVIGILACKIITKNDPYLLKVLLENILLSDRYIA